MTNPLLSLTSAAVVAAQLARALITDNQVLTGPPRKACYLCAQRSARHPAGPLYRYTRHRDHAGRAVCHRHG